MSKVDKQVLLEREKQLRKELNEASDAVEKEVVKAATIALVSGLVVWGTYKLLAPSSGSSESSGKKKKTKALSQGSGYAWVGRLASAVVPLIISQIGISSGGKKGKQEETDQ